MYLLSACLRLFPVWLMSSFGLFISFVLLLFLLFVWLICLFVGHFVHRYMGCQQLPISTHHDRLLYLGHSPKKSQGVRNIFVNINGDPASKLFASPKSGQEEPGILHLRQAQQVLVAKDSSLCKIVIG